MLPAMKPSSDKKSDADLLAWAAAILAQRQHERIFGVISVHLEGGTITRVRTEINELPPVTSPPKG